MTKSNAWDKRSEDEKAASRDAISRYWRSIGEAEPDYPLGHDGAHTSPNRGRSQPEPYRSAPQGNGGAALAELFSDGIRGVIEQMTQRELRVIRPIPTFPVGRFVTRVQGQGVVTMPCKVWHKDGLAMMVSEDPLLTIVGGPPIVGGPRATLYLPPQRELGWDAEPFAFWPALMGEE